MRDALVWAIPALLFGALLRVLLLSYVPYAYWGSDSRSYYSFTFQLMEHGDISLDEKRRYLYPLLMLPISLLPGVPLQWLGWVQHAAGLLSTVAVAYTVRKTLVNWKVAIVPVTVAWCGMPMVLWYEHELLGETLFFNTAVWAIAGWCAWVNEERLARSKRLFWWFLVPLAMFLFTKPSGRFVLPGICLGLLLVCAWRRLGWKHWAAFGAVVLGTLSMGSKKQAAWLLYVAVFPLTQLDTPKHAEYKAEIRPMVEPLRSGLDTYYLRDGEPFEFLEKPGEQEALPLWKKLDDDMDKRTQVYMDLALEGIKAEPEMVLYMAWQRILASVNFSEFKENRFFPEYYPERFRLQYDRGLKDLEKNKRTSVLTAMGIDKGEPVPKWGEMQERLLPEPRPWAARFIAEWVRIYDWAGDAVRLPRGMGMEERGIGHVRPTLVGCWLVLGAVLSLLPRYRRHLGVWMIVAASYLLGVFMVSQPNARYFGPAWAILIPLAAIPLDVAVSMLRSRRAERG